MEIIIEAMTTFEILHGEIQYRTNSKTMPIIFSIYIYIYGTKAHISLSTTGAITRILTIKRLLDRGLLMETN